MHMLGESEGTRKRRSNPSSQKKGLLRRERRLSPVGGVSGRGEKTNRAHGKK